MAEPGITVLTAPGPWDKVRLVLFCATNQRCDCGQAVSPLWTSVFSFLNGDFYVDLVSEPLSKHKALSFTEI